MDALIRLQQQVERLLAAHRDALSRNLSLEVGLKEDLRRFRQLEERLAQALRRQQELELECHELRDRLAALPDGAALTEARERLERLLAGLED